MSFINDDVLIASACGDSERGSVAGSVTGYPRVSRVARDCAKRARRSLRLPGLPFRCPTYQSFQSDFDFAMCAGRIRCRRVKGLVMTRRRLRRADVARGGEGLVVDCVCGQHDERSRLEL